MTDAPMLKEPTYQVLSSKILIVAPASPSQAVWLVPGGWRYPHSRSCTHQQFHSFAPTLPVWAPKANSFQLGVWPVKWGFMMPLKAVLILSAVQWRGWAFWIVLSSQQREPTVVQGQHENLNV